VRCHHITIQFANRALEKEKQMTDAVAIQTPQNEVTKITEEDSGFYTSLQLTTRAEKMAMLKAVNNSLPLLDKVGEEIAVVDVVLQAVSFPNDETGLIEDTVRTTLIDADGNAYHAASKGIAISLQQAFKVLGDPTTWEEPLVVTVEQGNRGKFRYLTLKF
jgi:hypothetical protein